MVTNTSSKEWINIYTNMIVEYFVTLLCLNYTWSVLYMDRWKHESTAWSVWCVLRRIQRLYWIRESQWEAAQPHHSSYFAWPSPLLSLTVTLHRCTALSPVSIQTQSLALRALRKRKPQETQALALVKISRNKRKRQPIGMLGRSSGNHDWLLANARACVSCGFRLRNARNASDCVWMETGRYSPTRIETRVLQWLIHS